MPINKISAALPFWLSLILIPIAAIAAIYGGWAIALLPLCTWFLFSFLDFLIRQQVRKDIC